MFQSTNNRHSFFFLSSLFLLSLSFSSLSLSFSLSQTLYLYLYFCVSHLFYLYLSSVLPVPISHFLILLHLFTYNFLYCLYFSKCHRRVNNNSFLYHRVVNYLRHTNKIVEDILMTIDAYFKSRASQNRSTCRLFSTECFTEN